MNDVPMQQIKSITLYTLHRVSTHCIESQQICRINIQYV